MRSDAGHTSRLSRSTISTSSARLASPASISSDTSCELKNRRRSRSTSPAMRSSSSSWLFSHPRPSTNTPPAYARILVPVFLDPFEARLQVVAMDPGTGRDGRRRCADREAVLHHGLARLDWAHGDLVARGHVVEQHDARVFDDDLVPGRQ